MWRNSTNSFRARLLRPPNTPPAPCCQAKGLGVVLLYTHSTVEGMVRNLKNISGSVEELLRLRE